MVRLRGLASQRQLGVNAPVCKAQAAICRLSATPEVHYIRAMKRLVSRPDLLLLAALGVAVGAFATGTAFAGWTTHGAAMFLAMAETGLSWCF
jgi:hypothetical protein